MCKECCRNVIYLVPWEDYCQRAGPITQHPSVVLHSSYYLFIKLVCRNVLRWWYEALLSKVKSILFISDLHFILTLMTYLY